jgi:hypothetical protein
MSKKDLNEKLVKEPLVQVMKKNGVMVEKVVEKPAEPSEDELYDELLSGVSDSDLQGTESGFGKVYSSDEKMSTSISKVAKVNGKTGFNNFYERQLILREQEKEPEKAVDDVISGAIKSASKKADAHYNAQILHEIGQIERKYSKDLPPDWRLIDEIVNAVSQVVSQNLEISIGKVKEVISRNAR